MKALSGLGQRQIESLGALSAEARFFEGGKAPTFDEIGKELGHFLG